MGQTEKQTHSTTPSEVREQRDRLFELDWIDAASRFKGEDFSKKAKTTLATIGVALGKLEEKYGKLPEFKQTMELYSDLRGDLNNHRPLDIDTSATKIMLELKKLSRQERVSPAKIPPGKLRSVLDGLNKLTIFKRGKIKVDYVLVSSDKAATVTLLLQTHSQSDFQVDPAAIPSQNRIKEIASGAVKAGLVDAIHTEGVPFGKKVSLEDARKSNGIDRILIKFPKLKMDGADEEGILATYFLEDKLGELGKQPKRGNLGELSFVFRNIFIADNIANIVKDQNYNHVISDIGLLHEANMKLTKEGRLFGNGAHPLPLSELLAREGLNVIVINTTNYPFDPKKE